MINRIHFNKSQVFQKRAACVAKAGLGTRRRVLHLERTYSTSTRDLIKVPREFPKGANDFFKKSQ